MKLARVRIKPPSGRQAASRYCWGNQLLMRYSISHDGTTVSAYLEASYKYFGGRRVGDVNDRLASEMSGGKKYYPYGEERSATAYDAYKFATYWREGYSGLDYADQRWYSSVAGRFLTPDPYQASGGVGNPGSWNRYGYVRADPVNLRDPHGLEAVDPCGGSMLTSAGVGYRPSGCPSGYTNWGPRPSVSEVYNSSGAGLGFGPASGGSMIGQDSGEFAVGEGEYTARTRGVWGWVAGDAPNFDYSQPLRSQTNNWGRKADNCHGQTLEYAGRLGVLPQDPEYGVNGGIRWQVNAADKASLQAILTGANFSGSVIGGLLHYEDVRGFGSDFRSPTDGGSRSLQVVIGRTPDRFGMYTVYADTDRFNPYEDLRGGFGHFALEVLSGLFGSNQSCRGVAP